LGCLNKQENMSWELSNTTWQKETHRRTNRTLIGLRLKVSSGSHRPLGHTSDTPEIEAEQDATMVQQNYRNSCHSGLPKPKVQQRTTSSAGHNPARDPIDPSDPLTLEYLDTTCPLGPEPCLICDARCKYVLSLRCVETQQLWSSTQRHAFLRGAADLGRHSAAGASTAIG
jgi:hypothetical protein